MVLIVNEWYIAYYTFDKWYDNLNAIGRIYPIAIAAGNNGINGPWNTMKSIHEKTFKNSGVYCTGFNKYGSRFDSLTSLSDKNNLFIIAGPDVQYIGQNSKALGSSNVSPIVYSIHFAIIPNNYKQ